MQRDLYPADWEEISWRIRFVRANRRCEECGATNGLPHPETGKRVVLTVAHLDHNPANCEDANLKALCQRCHLAYDAPEHARHAAETRRRKLVDAGQMEMMLS